MKRNLIHKWQSQEAREYSLMMAASATKNEELPRKLPT